MGELVCTLPGRTRQSCGSIGGWSGVYGVNYKDTAEKALGFLAELGDPYRALGADETGKMGLDWGLYGVPETYIIGRDGAVLKRFAGPITQRALEAEIRPVLDAARGE